MYLEENWDSSAVKMDLENLRALAKAEEGAPPIEEKDEKEKLIESVAIFVNYYAEKDKDADAMNLLKVR